MLAVPAPDDFWHFPRPELAAQFLRVFEIGLTSARGIFARRRMGKTEFLEKDLAPAAAKAGYRTAYINLWENRTRPGQAIIATIADAIEPKSFGAKVRQLLDTPVRKIRASGKVSGAWATCTAGTRASISGVHSDWASPPRSTRRRMR